VSTTKSIIYVPTSPQFSGECPQTLTAADLHSLLDASQALSHETVLAQLYQQLQAEKALRRQAEETLRVSEESLAIIQRLNHTVSWRWELDTDEVSCCNELVLLLDLPSQSCRSDALFGRVHPDDRAQVESDIYEALFDGRWLKQEYRILAGGAVHHLQCVGRAERGANGQLAFVGTAMDVSKRKGADEALRSARSELARVSRISAMGEFAASIAHEVNQPLAAIAMNAAAGLNWLKLDPPQLNQVHNALSTILRASTDAEKLIRSMNNMARRSGPELRRFAVDDAIREVLLLLRAELHEHRIQVCTDFTLAQHQLQADRVQLQQVMMNLFLNAIDAMSGVSCRTRVLKVCSAIADASGTLRISVEDNGRGIDASAAERIFDPLFSTKPAGMGMGLSICRSIVEAHGGRIWNCPRQPQGTTIHVSLPAAGPRN
jgi:signal transduction histidine kinase